MSIRARLLNTSFVLVVGFGLSSIASCSAANNQKVIDASKITLDVGDAVCQALEQVPNVPDKVKIACQYIDKVDGLSHIFLATVPASQARVMGLRWNPNCAPAPAPSASASGK